MRKGCLVSKILLLLPETGAVIFMIGKVFTANNLPLSNRILLLLFSLVLLIFGIIHPIIMTYQNLYKPTQIPKNPYSKSYENPYNFQQTGTSDNYRDKQYWNGKEKEESHNRFNTNGQEEKSNSKQEKQTNQPSRSDEWEQYFKILNLKDEPTITDVKKAYRKEIKKYHPDKVEHLGDEFKEVALKKTKDINEAYNYFRKKFDF